MGVKTALAGITLTTGGKNYATGYGQDYAGMLLEAQLKCQELTKQLNDLVTILTAAGGESSNISTINTQITALA